MRQEILSYLQARYSPISILLYGSYASETNDETSDFDCMLIVPEKNLAHDDTVVAGVQLDCFLYTLEETAGENLDAFLTLYDAQIVLDDGTGAALKQRVREYVRAHSESTPEEKEFLCSWMKKTCARVEKGDDEGCFRAISLLAVSLEDYCTLRDRFYFGSKKTIRLLQAEDPKGYGLFHDAVTRRTMDAILAWVNYAAACSTDL